MLAGGITVRPSFETWQEIFVKQFHHYIPLLNFILYKISIIKNNTSMQTTATLSLQPYLQSRWSFLHTVTWVPGRHQWRCFATACVTDTQHLVVPNASMMYYHTEWYHHISTLNQLDRHGVYRWFCCEKDQIGRALLTASATRPSLPSVPMPPIRSWSKECRKKVHVKSNFRTMAEWLAYGSGGSWVPRSNPSGGANLSPLVEWSKFSNIAQLSFLQRL